ncbi:MAG: flagellar FlbD family protein [Elusimicrobia bacterium]|nr:flagellar FlbD family protein [Candidatus Liberimonas magnetica]
MIKLHRLNGKEITVNAELIESIESAPDTIITLTSDNRFIVKETIEEVKSLIIEYRRLVSLPPLDVTQEGPAFRKQKNSDKV